MKTDFVIVGNMNVGKSTIFSWLSHTNVQNINIPGITLSVRKGKLKGLSGNIYDTPGIHSIFSSNEDERASRDIFLLPETRDSIKGLILVADAKNLKRSIAIALQYAEYGFPLVFNINMIDELASRGIEIDYSRLSELLGISVCTTIANEGIGVENLKSELENVSPLKKRITYPDKIEEFIALVDKLICQGGISTRIIALLLLTEDQCVDAYINDNCG